MNPLSEDLTGVLRRWHPNGLDEIERVRNCRPAGVHLTGTAGSGRSELHHELSGILGSAVDFVDSTARAAVVVIVVDASAPFGRVDVEQWRSALESTPVVFVVNKTDVHRDWREVLAADGAVVAECVPRAVEYSLHPTSVRLAQMGRDIGDAAMTSESGLGDVADRITALLLQAAALGSRRKYGAAVQDCVSSARASIVAKARAVTGGSDTARLRARRAELVAERESLGGDRRALLHNRIQRVRVEALHDAAEDLRALGAQFRQRTDRARRAELRHLPAHVAESAHDSQRRADAALTAAVSAVEAELGLSPMQAEARVESPVLDIGEPSRRRGIEDAVMIVVGASAGVGLGRLAASPMALVPAFAVANTVITLLLGAALAWWLTRSRALVADRAHLRNWTQESLSRVRSAVEQRLLSRLLDAESALAAAVAAVDRDEVARIDVALADVDAELRGLADRRSALLAAYDRDLSSLEHGLERFRAPGVSVHRDAVPSSAAEAEPFDPLVRRSR